MPRSSRRSSRSRKRDLSPDGNGTFWVNFDKHLIYGEVAERFIAPVLKTGVPSRAP